MTQIDRPRSGRGDSFDRRSSNTLGIFVQSESVLTDPDDFLIAEPNGRTHQVRVSYRF